MAEGAESPREIARGTQNKGTRSDTGNPGTYLGTEEIGGVAYARYRAERGTWVSASLKQAGYDRLYGRDTGYGAYAGVPRAADASPLPTPDRIQPGQEYLIPIPADSRQGAQARPGVDGGPERARGLQRAPDPPTLTSIRNGPPGTSDGTLPEARTRQRAVGNRATRADIAQLWAPNNPPTAPETTGTPGSRDVFNNYPFAPPFARTSHAAQSPQPYFDSSWSQDTSGLQRKVLDSWVLLRGSDRVRRWFIENWKVDPFESEITVAYTGKWGTDPFDIFALLHPGGVLAYTHHFTGTITFTPRFKGAVAEREVTAALMHELNNWAAWKTGSSFLDDYSSKGSYTSESIAYDVYDSVHKPLKSDPEITVDQPVIRPLKARP